MGDQNKEEDEKKVPVFTVFKKNSILKNIFLDGPPTNEHPNSTSNQEDEQVIVIGRHPDCSITLDHPSISRFHLRLHSKPSSLNLSLVDLSSVHGTWVSGKKVEPGVQVDLKEGDIVQLGGSSRLYMLNWVPVSRAYNLDVPFVPPMNGLMTVKETEELSNQDENCCSSIETNQIQSQCTSMRDLDLSVSKKEMTVSPSTPIMPEFGDSSCDNEEAKKGLSREEHRQYEISGVSSGQPPREELIEKIKNQHSDEGSENSPNASSPSNDHNKDFFREAHEKNEISGFSSGTPLQESSVSESENQQSDEENVENPQALAGILTGISSAKSSSGNHNKNLLRKAHEENEISAFSSGQLLNESVLEIINEQFDKDNKNSQALDGAISGTAYVNSPIIDHNEHLLKEEHQISAFSSGQLLNESVVEIAYQQYDEEYENSQDLNGAVSGIADANSTLTIDHCEHPLREEFEENEISAFSSGQLLNESVLEIKYMQYGEEYEESQPLDGVLSGISNANSIPPIDHHEHRLLSKEFEEHEISASLYGQLLNESVSEIECQQYDEVCENSQALDGVLSGIADANSSLTLHHNDHRLKEEFEKNEISPLMSVQLLIEPVVEIGNQQYDEDYEKSQAVDGVLSSVQNAHSLCQNYHNKNFPEFFDSSFSDEDAEIIYASRMENEQKKMLTSGCYSSCSSTFERNNWIYLNEQDHVLYYSTSAVHAIQPLRNTSSKSQQESNCSEIIRNSLSDVCAVFDESPKVLDNEGSLKGDNEQKEITVITGAPKMDLMNLSICYENSPTEDCFEQLDEKNNMEQIFAINVSEPKDTDVTPLRSGEQSDPRSIRGKPTIINIQTGTWEGKCTGFPADTEVEDVYKENVDYESVSEALISNVEVFTEEIFTPDKENFTPNILQQRSTVKTDKLEQIKLSNALCLSSPAMSSICNFVQNEELIFSSDKENHTPKVLQKSRLVRPAAAKNPARLNVEPATKNRVSRIPFKSLLSNSSSKNCSNDSTIKSSNSGKYVQPTEKNAVAGDKKRWVMIADTNCLLNKVSRKALQLLQGVKGTQLIIPRVVIKELDCMKRRGYLFRRTREISSALQWIEDCMINTNWWIHVESLMEEGRHLTPAASLSTSEGEIKDFGFSSVPFSALPKFLEIISPTPGDHILECALLNSRMKNDEDLVILSDDVSLKIKAMAEGIICEAAEEFRENLVNPFSDRFLWAKSSPRGLTWSCVDDIVLREKYYRGPFKKPQLKSGDNLKGLKLILVQSSHFTELVPN